MESNLETIIKESSLTSEPKQNINTDLNSLTQIYKENESYCQQNKRFKKYINILLNNGYNTAVIERSVKIATFYFQNTPEMFRCFNDELRCYIGGEPFDLNYFFKFSAQTEEDLVKLDKDFCESGQQRSMQEGRKDPTREAAFNEIQREYSKLEKGKTLKKTYKKDIMKSVWASTYEKELESKTKNCKQLHYKAFRSAYYYSIRETNEDFSAKYDYALKNANDDEKFRQMIADYYMEIEGNHFHEIQKYMCYIWDCYFFDSCQNMTELQQFKSWQQLTRLIIHLLEKHTINFWDKMLQDIRRRKPSS